MSSSGDQDGKTTLPADEKDTKETQVSGDVIDKDEAVAESSRVIDSFVLEEYKNISKAHYELHNGFRQMFRFYLGIVAVPVTIFAFVYKDSALSVGSLPTILTYMLILIALIGFLMFLSLINIRFDIIFYTRTVNGTRKYFIDLSRKLNHHNLEKYLLLPGDTSYPPYRETFKAYWWQFCMIAILNTLYLLIGIRNLSFWSTAIKSGIGFFIVHGIFYHTFAWAKGRSKIGKRSGNGV